MKFDSLVDGPYFLPRAKVVYDKVFKRCYVTDLTIGTTFIYTALTAKDFTNITGCVLN
jgi:hypothetical protein